MLHMASNTGNIADNLPATRVCGHGKLHGNSLMHANCSALVATCYVFTRQVWCYLQSIHIKYIHIKCTHKKDYTSLAQLVLHLYLTRFHVKQVASVCYILLWGRPIYHPPKYVTMRLGCVTLTYQWSSTCFHLRDVISEKSFFSKAGWKRIFQRLSRVFWI